MMNMNERIKQLALAAFQPINDIASEGVADFHTFNQPWFQLYNQEFAELIVRECIEHLESSVAVPNMEHSRVKWKCIRAIKEHFGVEE
jgi:hypothetical protein